MSRRSAASVATEEISQFSRHAADWWNPEGSFRPLHKLNPIRLEYIRDQACEHFGRNPESRHALKDLKILDVGCGGGLLAEPMTRMGGQVTGLDASEEGITVARAHAKGSGLKIDYQVGSVEAWTRKKNRYDLITALEIVEHVADLESFIGCLTSLLQPNGLLIMSTLNRTPKSFLLGIVAAEYVLGWVPKGTHQWQKFLRPSELVGHLDDVELKTTDLTGMIFNPLRGEFQLSPSDLGVNYMLTAVRRPRG
ncbi:MAG: bifunctional 2-polyprenyl-6-hydroxyphenol methylase/3-demethylubiquinol 3-O-methyltransferase UbiG [Alphaproteobacteria bacterium]|nr:bifunctional 2-polyprenyl-6-hydroxyphenol methylase/3-demethylubiquinol 3-O-methyltransferase UbiG [Alphaproteobacteria bacterium]